MIRYQPIWKNCFLLYQSIQNVIRTNNKKTGLNRQPDQMIQNKFKKGGFWTLQTFRQSLYA